LSEAAVLEEVRKLLSEAIRNTEFEGRVWFAGGCVRDDILDRQTQDIDLTVELPEGGIRLAEHLHKCGLASKPVVYRQFGTALVSIAGYKIELVMTRRESYRYRSRKPETEFGSLAEDVLRRDFTVNSLLKSVSDGKVLDLSGRGLADIRSKLIRATSRPEIIFREDPLRLLRAVRFAVTLGFEIDPDTLKYIKRHADAIQHISNERIAEEMLKILQCRDWTEGLRILSLTNLKRYIFPGLGIPSGLYKMKPGKLNLMVRLAALFYMSRDATVLLNNLKLPKSDVSYIQRLINECKQTRTLAAKGRLQSDSQLRRRAYETEPVSQDFAMLYGTISALRSKGENQVSRDRILMGKISRTARQMQKHRFSLTGDDLIRTFCIRSGPEVGRLLTKALGHWFKYPETGKAGLLDFLKANEPKLRQRMSNK
jgi:tRNA nucleotidyltransferase/poly(A) polymerase